MFLRDDHVVVLHFLRVLVHRDRHLAVTAADHFVLFHIGDGILGRIIYDRVNTSFRIVYRTAQRLCEFKRIRHMPEHIAVHDHRLLIGRDDIR